MNDHHYPSMLKMNQQCKVCGEPAAGFHFGAFTCEGCKSFFGRSYNNLSSISECKNGGQCVINKKNRTSCKACRLRKCLVVGMSKSGSRYGRRSNWFKIHCLLQEQANNNNNHHNNNTTELLHHRTYENKSPSPNTASMLHRQFSPFARPMQKHEEMDDYKTSSPSISSPESHNSDSSVEISDARLGLLNGLKHKNDVKDFFMPLPFLPPGLMQNSPFAAAAAAAMAAQHAQKFLFPPNSPYFGLYPPQLPIKPEKPETEEMVYSKRFYLDAILQSQRSSPSSRVSPSRVSPARASPPKQSPISSPVPEKIVIREKRPLSPAVIQDNPIDLSMKSRASSHDSHMDSDIESEKSIKLEHSDSEEKIDFSEESDCEIPKGRVTPLDLTKRLETAA